MPTTSSPTGIGSVRAPSARYVGYSLYTRGVPSKYSCTLHTSQHSFPATICPAALLSRLLVPSTYFDVLCSRLVFRYSKERAARSTLP